LRRFGPAILSKTGSWGSLDRYRLPSGECRLKKGVWAMASNEANLFDLHGDGIFVSYSATSINGDPILSYHDRFRNLNFRGKDVQVEKTQIGDLVTVAIAPSIDSGFTSFSILIPKTNVSDAGHVNVTTVGVTTLHRRLVVGPPLLGQTEIYHTHHLVGTGHFVVP
jgi:hypothetical protein